MIKCDFYDYDYKQWRQYEKNIEDTTIDNINNSLKTNKLENILKEFKKVLNEDVWNSNKCPALCKETCER